MRELRLIELIDRLFVKQPTFIIELYMELNNNLNDDNIKFIKLLDLIGMGK